MKFKALKLKFKMFNQSWIMEFIDTLHIIVIIAVKVKVVAFGLAYFQVLFLFFWGIYFLSPLIFPLGLFTLFLIFYYFSFFQIWENNLQKLSKSIQNFMNPIIIGP